VSGGGGLIVKGHAPGVATCDLAPPVAVDRNISVIGIYAQRVAGAAWNYRPSTAGMGYPGRNASFSLGPVPVSNLGQGNIPGSAAYLQPSTAWA
jgi:hypothetical protein